MHATPTPLTPVGLFVVDLSPLAASLAPKCPKISDIKLASQKHVQ